MKTAIIRGAKVGAITGFVSALGYAGCILLICELYLPIPNPSINVIFNKDIINDFVFEILLSTSITWLSGSTLFGMLSAIGFMIYLEKLHPPRKMYVFACTFACTIIVSPILLITVVRPIFIYFFNGVYHPFINPIIDELLETGFPSFVYIFAGYIASNYLYKNEPAANIQPPSP